MKEIRFHGRGGQGAVMASEMLVHAMLMQGQFGNAIPFFGFERRGAPVAAFVRIDEKPIREKTQIYSPQCLVIIDSTVRSAVDVFAGLRDPGIVVMNYRGTVDELGLPPSVRRIGLVDATGVALEVLGVPITNTAMLGSFAATTGWVKLESVLESFKAFFSGRQLEANQRAARLAYEKTTVIDLAVERPNAANM